MPRREKGKEGKKVGERRGRKEKGKKRKEKGERRKEKRERRKEKGRRRRVTNELEFKPLQGLSSIYFLTINESLELPQAPNT